MAQAQSRPPIRTLAMLSPIARIRNVTAAEMVEVKVEAVVGAVARAKAEGGAMTAVDAIRRLTWAATSGGKLNEFAMTPETN
jgi:hypothetical protein